MSLFETPAPQQADPSKRRPYRDQELVDWLRGYAKANPQLTFVASLVRFFDEKGFLTAKQTNAALKIRDEERAKTEQHPDVRGHRFWCSHLKLSAALCDCGHAERAGRRPVAVVTGTREVPDGRYTVVFDDDEYRTLRVHTQDEHANFKPGVKVISYLSGSDNDSDYTSFGHFDSGGNVVLWKKHRDNKALAEAVKVLVGDPKAAALAYARASGNCSICNRTLTVPESIKAGIGPVCARKAGW